MPVGRTGLLIVRGYSSAAMRLFGNQCSRPFPRRVHLRRDPANLKDLSLFRNELND
ncbi:MAG: hypothetical protein ACOY90_02670 [Candidatus Zhuqueibacterota bacterium]